MPTLRVKIADQPEVTHILQAERVTIGRRPDNTIQIVDRSVSGHHAELILEDNHYRLHDLGSTNLSFVEGSSVGDYHLRTACKVAFGNVQCEFDPKPSMEASGQKLTYTQLEQELAFLRAENQELQNKITALQRRVDILSSARLVTGTADTQAIASPEQLKKLSAERDEYRFQVSGLRLELERLRNELAETARERDSARQSSDLLEARRAVETNGQRLDKDSTQRIHLFPHPPTVSDSELGEDSPAHLRSL